MGLNEHEQFIIDLLKDNGNKMNYKAIQIACENEFEGVRLVFKIAKRKRICVFRWSNTWIFF